MNLLCVAAACSSFIFSSQKIEPKKSQLDECVKVMVEAEKQGLSPELAAAVAWKESRFNPNAKSSKGAVGTMQIIPRYWCPNKKECDSVKYGIIALKKLNRLYGAQEYLCRYASGKSCKLASANQYRQSVERLARRVSEAIKVSCVTGC